MEKVVKFFCYLGISISILVILGIQLGLLDYLAEATGTRIGNWLYGFVTVILLLTIVIVGLFSFLKPGDYMSQKEKKDVATRGFSYHDLNP